MRKPSADVLFTWHRPNSGHEWKQKGRWRGAQYLVPLVGAVGSKKPGRATEYVPRPGLFRTFAGLYIAKDEVRERELKAFADAYGDIIAQPHEGHITISDETPWGEITRKHASVETWCRTIQHMRRAVDLWDRINDPKRHGELQGLFVRSKGAITYRRVHHPLERKVDNDSYLVIAVGKAVAAYPAGDQIGPARRALWLEIRDALTDIQTPSYSTPYLARDSRLVLYPVDLLAYMWLMFAHVVSGEIKERPCEMFESCHEYIYVGSGPWLQRIDTTTCSAACRQKKKRQDANKR